MLYNVMNPMGYVNEGYRYAAATTAAMDRGYKEIRSQEAPGHSGWGAVSNAFGGGFAGYHLGKLLGEAGLSLPPLLGGASTGAGELANSGAEAAAGSSLGLTPGPWGALLGASIGLLSYLFS